MVLDEFNFVLDVVGLYVLNEVICDFKLLKWFVVLMIYCFLVIVECDWFVMIENGFVCLEGLRDSVLKLLMGDMKKVIKIVVGE